jgi:hypothetical protein
MANDLHDRLSLTAIAHSSAETSSCDPRHHVLPKISYWATRPPPCERSIVRGDGGSVHDTAPPSRREARSRLGDKAANEPWCSSRFFRSRTAPRARARISKGPAMLRDGAGWQPQAASANTVGHSITSSARCWSWEGTSRPSALAVLRLTTSSNLVGAWTGSSPGFSPLRMRST